MRKTRFARPQPRSAPDDRSGRRAVMRGAKRRVADERMVWIDETRDGMDPGDLERLLLLERRQDSRQPAGEHGLARAGWAAEQQVVTARGRQLECTASSFLAANVGEIEQPPPRLAVAYDVL